MAVRKVRVIIREICARMRGTNRRAKCGWMHDESCGSIWRGPEVSLTVTTSFLKTTLKLLGTAILNRSEKALLPTRGDPKL